MMNRKKISAEMILEYAKKHNEHFFIRIHPEGMVLNTHLDEINILENGVEFPDGNIIPYDLISEITSKTPKVNK